MAGRQARPGRGVGDKGEQGNNPSLVQPSGSSAGWPSPISRQLTRPPAHSQPPQLDPTPLSADWPEEAQALARRQPGRYGATPRPRLPHGCRLSQQPRMEDSALGWAKESQPPLDFPKSLLTVLCCLSARHWTEFRANAFGKCWFKPRGVHQAFPFPRHTRGVNPSEGTGDEDSRGWFQDSPSSLL